MPLVLAPSFDDHTREEVEAHLDLVRIRRIAGVVEYQKTRLMRIEGEHTNLVTKLERNLGLLCTSIEKLDKDLERVEFYLANVQMLKNEIGLVDDRLKLAKE